MSYGRDPLSWHYDGYVRQVMIRAIRAGRNNTGVRVYIASSRAEFRSPDKGGRTRHERAFTRSVYYLMWRSPDQRRDGARVVRQAHVGRPAPSLKPGQGGAAGDDPGVAPFAGQAARGEVD